MGGKVAYMFRARAPELSCGRAGSIGIFANQNFSEDAFGLLVGVRKRKVCLVKLTLEG